MEEGHGLDIDYEEFPGSIKIENGKVIIDYKLLVVLAVLWGGGVKFLESYPDVRDGLTSFSTDLTHILLTALNQSASSRDCRVDDFFVKRMEREKIDKIIQACLREEKIDEYYRLKERIKFEMEGTDY